MNPISGFIIICLILTLGYGIGLLKFMSDYEKDKCEMTYMFEYPQFVRISNKIDKQYPKYGLYAYSEGRITSKARNMYFDGIPVMFIPGNGGSYRQVRSLSSIALRKALNSRTSYHFDYFTIDLNDEFNGLYGPLLYDQFYYVNNSLYKILELYKERQNKPKSVIIIGHSMGGVIALKLASQVTDPNLCPLVITLAAPLKRPPVIMDYHMQKFYENERKIPDSTTVISLSGGYSDFLIPSYLSAVEGKNTLYVVTTNIPLSWVEANHVQIVWCKQTVLALNRALFDSVNINTKQISLNATYRHMVFKHHLIHHSGTKVQNRQMYSKAAKIDHKGQWIESLLRQYSVHFLHGLKETHWYMVRLSSLPNHEMLFILAINLEVVDWAFACNANYPRGPNRVCTEGVHLTHLSEIAPSIKYKRRLLQLNMNEIKKNNTELTHIIFRALPTDEPVVFHVDIYNSAERQIMINLPSWWRLQRNIIVDKTIEKTLHYELVLPQLQHIIQFYQLFVEPQSCVTEYHHASASLTVPWSNENYNAYFTNTEKKPLDIRLYSSRPPSADLLMAKIKLILEPSCTYRISIKPSIFGTLGQIARNYTPLLLTNIAAVILMALKHQLSTLKTNHCSIFFIAIKEGAKPYYVLTIAKLFSKFFSGVKLPSLLPKLDISYLTDEGTDFFLLPLLLYLCSVGIVWLLAIIFCISLITLESTTHKLALKLLAHTVSFTISWSDYLMSALHKIPCVVVAVLILLCLSTCGSLALCLGAFFYFLKLTRMSQDYIEEVVWLTAKDFAKKIKTMLTKPKSKAESSGERRVVQHEVGTSREISEESGHSDEIKKTSVEGDNIQAQKNQIVSSEGDGRLNKNSSAERDDGEVQLEQQNSEQNEQKLEGNQNKQSEKQIPKQLSSTYNAIFFHSTLFFIWCIITVINIPAVLTWAHNFKFNKILIADDSFIPGIALSFCALPLWQFDFPKVNRKWFDKLEIFVMAIAVVCLMFATVSLYRLNYLLTLTMVVITLHQLFAPVTEKLANEAVDNSDMESRIKYGEIKAKLE